MLQVLDAALLTQGSNEDNDASTPVVVEELMVQVVEVARVVEVSAGGGLAAEATAAVSLSFSASLRFFSASLRFFSSDSNLLTLFLISVSNLLRSTRSYLWLALAVLTLFCNH